MSVYKGTFVVVNETGGNISNLTVSHICTGQPTATLPPCSLTQGQKSAATPFTTETTSKDRWSLSFLNGGNELRTGQENCGFESEDNNGVVTITLYLEEFDITMPVSSPCNNNDYQQT